MLTISLIVFTDKFKGHVHTIYTYFSGRMEMKRYQEKVKKETPLHENEQNERKIIKWRLLQNCAACYEN